MKEIMQFIYFYFLKRKTNYVSQESKPLFIQLISIGRKQ